MAELSKHIYAIRWRMRGDDPSLLGISVHRDPRAATIFAETYLKRNPNARADNGNRETPSKYTIGVQKLPVGRKNLSLLDALKGCQSAFFSISSSKKSAFSQDFNRLSGRYPRADIPIEPIEVCIQTENHGQSLAQDASPSA